MEFKKCLRAINLKIIPTYKTKPFSRILCFFIYVKSTATTLLSLAVNKNKIAATQNRKTERCGKHIVSRSEFYYNLFFLQATKYKSTWVLKMNETITNSSYLLYTHAHEYHYDRDRHTIAIFYSPVGARQDRCSQKTFITRHQVFKTRVTRHRWKQTNVAETTVNVCQTRAQWAE